MKTTTELIDAMNRVEAGDRVVVRTDDGEAYRGRVVRTEYSPPAGADGFVAMALEVGERRLEVRADTEPPAGKFARPELRAAGADGERLGVVGDVQPDA